MKRIERSTFGPALVVLVLLLAAPVGAQEDEAGGDDEGWGSFHIDWGTWAAVPEGASGGVVTFDTPLDPFDATVLSMDHNSETEHWVRVGVELARNVGRVTVTRYAHESEAHLGMREPGEFIFGELLAYPVFAGYTYDGYADAFDASHGLALRESKVEFSRLAFSSSRVEGRWSVGIRKVSLDSRTEATYFALVPDFPPIAAIPPAPSTLPANLVPIPDVAQLSSQFDGSGLTAGMEFRAPLGTPKIMLEASFGMAVLVGNIDSGYSSQTSAYIDSQTGNIVEAPFSEFTIPGFADGVVQSTFVTALQNRGQSVTSEVLELSFGARWKATNFMDLFLGFRTTHYGNVITEIRPTSVVVVGSTANLVDLDERERPITYEGFYGGVGFHF